MRAVSRRASRAGPTPSSRGRGRYGGKEHRRGGRLGVGHCLALSAACPYHAVHLRRAGVRGVGGKGESGRRAVGRGRLSRMGHRVRAARLYPTKGGRAWCEGSGREERRGHGKTAALSGVLQALRKAHVRVAQEAWPIGCLLLGLRGVFRRDWLAIGPVPLCRHVGAQRRLKMSPAPERRRRGADLLSRAVRSWRACEESPRVYPTPPAET